VWIITKRAELGRLIEILDTYPLRAKKARDYAIWREAVRIWLAMRPTGGLPRRDWSAFEELAQRLRDVRVYR
jgi:hypothetical protein